MHYALHSLCITVDACVKQRTLTTQGRLSRNFVTAGFLDFAHCIVFVTEYSVLGSGSIYSFRCTCREIPAQLGSLDRANLSHWARC
jgi:hypothetical protein